MKQGRIDVFDKRQAGRWMRNHLRLAPQTMAKLGRRKLRTFLRRYLKAEREYLQQIRIYTAKDVKVTTSWLETIADKKVVHTDRDSVILEDKR